MSLTTPAARRDLSFHLHPATNLRHGADGGTARHHARRRRLRVRRRRQPLSRRHGRAVVRVARLLGAAARRRRVPADVRAAVLSQLRGQGAGDQHRARRAAGPRWRRPAWARRCSPTRAPRRTTPRSSSPGTSTTRSAGRRRRRSSRGSARYHGVTVAAASLTGLAFAHSDFDLPIARILHTDCPLPLPRRASRAKARSVRGAARRQARAADPARGPRHRRRILRRAGDGRGRRDRRRRRPTSSASSRSCGSTTSCSSSTK